MKRCRVILLGVFWFWASLGFAETHILAIAEKDGKHGAIDLQGRVVIPFDYNGFGFWQEGLISVHRGGLEADSYHFVGGQWGFCDGNGKLVIPLLFEGANGFSDGLAAVQYGGKWGYINRKGHWVIPPRYEEADEFSEGLAAVKLQDCWGFVNQRGDMVITPNFYSVRRFEQGRCAVFLHQQPRQPIEFQELLADENGEWGLVDRSGVYVVPPQFLSIGPFQDGLATIEVKDSETSLLSKYGFIDECGELVIPPIFDAAEGFFEGSAVVGVRKSTYEVLDMVSGDDMLYGCIHCNGKWIIPPTYDLFLGFHGGWGATSLGPQQHWMFISSDSTGKNLHNEDFPIANLIDETGKEQFERGFYWRIQPIHGTAFFFAERRDYRGTGVIDANGKVLLGYQYTNLRYLGEGLFSADEGVGSEKVAVINLKGETLFESSKFEMPSSEYEYGLFHVRTGHLSKSGFVDRSGRFVIPAIYDYVRGFEEV